MPPWPARAGRPTHPQWFHNLQAQPDIDLQDGTETFAVHARVVEGAGA